MSAASAEHGVSVANISAMNQVFIDILLWPAPHQSGPAKLLGLASITSDVIPSLFYMAVATAPSRRPSKRGACDE